MEDNTPRNKIGTQDLTADKLNAGLDPEKAGAPEIKAAFRALFPKIDLTGISFQKDASRLSIALSQKGYIPKAMKQNFREATEKLYLTLLFYQAGMQEKSPTRTRSLALLEDALHDKKLEPKETALVKELSIPPEHGRMMFFLPASDAGKNRPATTIIRHTYFLARALNEVAAAFDKHETRRVYPHHYQQQLRTIQSRELGG